MNYEVAVIGAGVMGSSAAHYLAQSGRKTVLIDQFPLPHARGSSGGHSRITRQANYGNSAVTPLMAYSNIEWMKIQEQSGLTIFRPSPLVCVGPGDSPTVGGYLERLDTSIRSAGFLPKTISIEQANEKYGTKFPQNYKCIIDPSAGVLFADKCIQAFRKLFVDNGGVILDNWPVKSITPGDVVEVKGANGKVVRAKSVVICPGPWLGPVMEDLGLKFPVWAEKIGVFYWKIRDPENTPEFILIDLSEGENHFYALPDFEYPGYMKLAPHVGPKAIPNERDKSDVTPLLQKAQSYINKHLPFLEATPSVIESCMYTMTPDQSFILDRHPKHRNIVFAGGFSGTGFKLAPACGQALAKMAIGLEPKLDFSSFKCQRFSPNQLKSRL